MQRNCGPDGVPWICTAEGIWSSLAPCESSACVEGTCIGTCRPNQKRCTAKRLEVCSAAGDWTLQEMCDLVCLSSATGASCGGTCQPGASRCLGTESQACNAKGEWEAGSRDCQGPIVVSGNPKVGASGVRADEKVVIVFDEPMDRKSVEAAVSITGGIAGMFSWNSASTELTITPVGGWKYAAGTSINLVSAQEYTVSVAVSATDLVGNALQKRFVTAFSTLRRITALATPEASLTGSVFKAEDGMNPSKVMSGSIVSRKVAKEALGSGTIRGFLSFGLGNLPGNLAKIEEARLALYCEYLGVQSYHLEESVVLEKVRYPILAVEAFDTSAAGGLATVGSLEFDEKRDLDVTQSLAEEVVAGRQTFQVRFRLQEEYGPNQGDHIAFYGFAGALPPSLSVVFLVP